MILSDYHFYPRVVVFVLTVSILRINLLDTTLLIVAEVSEDYGGSYITTSRMKVVTHAIFIRELFQTILNGNDNLFKNVKIDKQVQTLQFLEFKINRILTP